MVETQLQLSVCRQAHTVAGVTELMADSADKPDRSFESVIFHVSCRTVSMNLTVRNGLAIGLFQDLLHFRNRNSFRLAAASDRHQFNKAHT